MRAYLDHASTSPTRAGAIEAMLQWLRSSAADPGRIHAEGMQSRVALETARDQVGELLGARPREVVFTSGATEAIAMAHWGAVNKFPERRHVVFGAVEHSAVRDSASRAWVSDASHTEVGVDALGRVDPDELMAAVRDDTCLVNLQWGNHEVATLQPVAEIVARCRQAGVLVHVDAAQAAGRVPIDFVGLGADLMSVSAHKFGGPPGVGALLVRRGLRLAPLLLGGDQERARRAGMENVPAVLGMGAAADELTRNLDQEADHSMRLSDRVLQWAAGAEGINAYGDPVDRLPHIVCLGIEDIEPQPVLLGLDQRGVAVHSGSSCSTESLEPSPVLEAMGADAQRSLRISFGHDSTEDEVDQLLVALPAVLDGLRELRR